MDWYETQFGYYLQDLFSLWAKQRTLYVCTVVPRLTTLIHSSEIAVERKCKAK